MSTASRSAVVRDAFCSAGSLTTNLRSFFTQSGARKLTKISRLSAEPGYDVLMAIPLAHRPLVRVTVDGVPVCYRDLLTADTETGIVWSIGHAGHLTRLAGSVTITLPGICGE